MNRMNITLVMKLFSGNKCLVRLVRTIVGSSMATFTPSCNVGTEKCSVGRDVSHSLLTSNLKQMKHDLVNLIRKSEYYMESFIEKQNIFHIPKVLIR